MEDQHEEDAQDLQRVRPQLRNKHPKRRVKAKLRDDRQVASGPNDVWAMDFVHDQLATGKKMRILTVVDIRSRYCPAIDAPVHVPWRGCGPDAGARLQEDRPPQDDQGRQRQRIISRDLDLWTCANSALLRYYLLILIVALMPLLYPSSAGAPGGNCGQKAVAP